MAGDTPAPKMAPTCAWMHTLRVALSVGLTVPVMMKGVTSAVMHVVQALLTEEQGAAAAEKFCAAVTGQVTAGGGD